MIPRNKLWRLSRTRKKYERKRYRVAVDRVSGYCYPFVMACLALTGAVILFPNILSSGYMIMLSVALVTYSLSALRGLILEDERLHKASTESITIFVHTPLNRRPEQIFIQHDAKIQDISKELQRRNGLTILPRIKHEFTYNAARHSTISYHERLCDLGVENLCTLYLRFYVLGGSQQSVGDINSESGSTSSASPRRLTDIQLNKLTVQEILRTVASQPMRLVIPAKTRRNKMELVRYIIAYGETQLLDSLRKHVEAKDSDSNGSSATGKKRPREDVPVVDSSRKSMREDGEVQGAVPANDSVRPPGEFMEVPTQEEIRRRHQAFYHATSNATTKPIVCAVCARENELRLRPSSTRCIPIGQIPHPERLVPHSSHPAHTLYDGKLLDDAGIDKSPNGELLVNVCSDCWHDLSGKKALPPKFSLANDMWIGKVPAALKGLTFPEQLLIAQLYPRVYVFKLFPKKVQGKRDADTLQRGMRGNVTTFELDSTGIVSMLKGNLMPRPPSVLASVITITYVGLGELPKSWLRTTFRVRRHAVRAALQTLKETCPKYYGEIEIDDDRLASLPEDDVPDEILSMVRQSDDAGIVDEEGASGYVPTEEDDTIPESEGGNKNESANTESGAPDVIPLQISGTIDTDTTKLSGNELMKWGLLNLWQTADEGAYAVRHGTDAVSDFGRPYKGKDDGKDRSTETGTNFFERAFPLLFPYGRGGIEADRPNPVDFSEHVRWALRYHDGRFRRHETFPFTAFGIQQRRQSLGAARVQTTKKNFDADARLMSTITVEKLQEAQKQEERGERVADPAVRILRSHIHASAGKVMGSNASKYRLKSQIWSTSISLGPPSLWITINPCDLHDPIAQVFAGADIDLDSFISTLGPDDHIRAQNIAQDPYAAAKFFHFLIHTILETLFGVRVTRDRIHSEKGIFGYVSSYFGVVESQGRGSLHLHMLLWLRHAPSLAEMQELLKSEVFRMKVREFIRSNSRAYVPGLESRDTTCSIRNEVDIAYSRPPNPFVGDDEDYQRQCRDFELRVARAKQVHTCELRRCLKVDSKGSLVCKRRAPFEVSEEAYVNEDGSWCPERRFAYMNAWGPTLSLCMRCNNDVKVLLNGRETVNISYYVTGYSHKNQQKTHNISAIVAKNLAYHLERSQYFESLQDQQRLLLFRIINAVNSEQELAAPMVISFLMGWGDTYHSHRYTPVYWSSFVAALLKKHPELVRPREEADQIQETASKEDEKTIESQDTLVNDSETDEYHKRQADIDDENGDETAILDIDVKGKLYIQSQVMDYCFRGEGLENYSAFDFFADTWEDKEGRKAKNSESDDAEMSGDADLDEAEDDNVGDKKRGPRAGRPAHARFPYAKNHPAHGKKLRVKRGTGHNTLPNFVGRYFPRRNNDDESDNFYYASMLLLLRPWRNLEVDLKKPEQSWRDAYDEMIRAASTREKSIIEGIQFFHSCQRAAQEARELEGQDIIAQAEAAAQMEEDFDDLEELQSTTEAGGLQMSQAGLALLKASLQPHGENNWGTLAVMEAQKCGLLPRDIAEGWDITTTAGDVTNATGDDISNLINWLQAMDSNVNAQSIGEQGDDRLGNEEGTTDRRGRKGKKRSGKRGKARVDVLDANRGPSTDKTLPDAEVEEALPKLDITELRPDQRRAYDIVAWHLDQTLSGYAPPPLRMIVHGEGGTGKSRVIQTITEMFEARTASSMLLKGAYTGIAASLISGKTLHNIGKIAVGSSAADKMNDDSKAKHQEFWKEYQYLIIDECSMISREFLAQLEKNISIGKGVSTSGKTFGGINVVLCGDFHQFPPVAATNDALYMPSSPGLDKVEQVVGRAIYEGFTTVVILREQMRIVDREWKEMLTRLRYGRIEAQDLDMLRGLVVSLPECPNTDFTQGQWQGAALVTPRHGVRRAWNDAALRTHCRAKGQQVFVCRAQDTVNGRDLNIAEEYGLALRSSQRTASGKRRNVKQDLPEALSLAIGARVMVVQNIETELDLANGARGTIVDIVLHPDEPPLSESEGVVELKYLPQYILVKLDRTRVKKLAGLEKSVIPIQPRLQTMRISVQQKKGPPAVRTVKRMQYPLTLAYAFTDYRSQGQTIVPVVIDIATPPGGTLTLFNIYVALSRSAGRQSIRLLRDFDASVLLKGHAPELLMEDDRLEGLEKATRSWWEEMSRART